MEHQEPFQFTSWMPQDPTPTERSKWNWGLGEKRREVEERCGEEGGSCAVICATEI